MGEQFAAQLDLFGVSAPAVGGQPVATASADMLDQETLLVAVDPTNEVAPKPAAVSAPATPVQLRAIEDAGEELRYNRRNRTRGAKTWGDIAPLNDALKVKEAVKGNVWPKPDYEALVTDGMAPMVAHIVKQVYDAVAVKPMVGRAILDDVTLERYVTALNRVEKGLMEWINDRHAVQKWVVSNAKVAGAMLGHQVALSELSPSANSLLDSVFPEGWKEARPQLLIAGGNKLLSALQPGYEEIRRAMKAIDTGWPQKREAWEVQGFKVMANPAVVVEPASRSVAGNLSCFLSINDRYVRSFDSLAEGEAAAAEIKPFALFGKRGFVESFDSEEQAVDVAKDLTRREKGRVVSEKGTSVVEAKREGVNRRMDGEDITAEQLMETFGFRGVNFGNWMKTPAARVEAQMHLNHAFDAFHDLADILGIPPLAISLNGMLGMAIGAQGGGSALAHFVPGLNEINLTRTAGAGALAHEWAHALDHAFATQAGLATSSEPFLTEHVRLGDTRSVFQVVDGRQVSTKIPRFGGLRPEIIAGFKTIVEAMDKRMQTPEEVSAAQSAYDNKITKSLTSWLNSIRRDFGDDAQAFDILAERVMSRDFGEGKSAVGRSTYISPVVAEMRDLYKATHKRTYSLENTKALQCWIDSAIYQKSKAAADEVHLPQRVSTDFAKNASKLDHDKGGKPYWSTTLEKFARAFDAYITDVLDERAAKNDYLSFTGRDDETVPRGDDRQAVNAAFRGLVADLRVRETEHGTAIFSTGSHVAASMPVDAIKPEIERLRAQWPAMPKVTVVNRVSDLPFEAPANADGAFYKREVFVIAENLVDLKQLQKVMAHECIMHFSLEEMLGDYGFSKLHHGIQRLKAEGNPVVCALAENIAQRYGPLSADIETREIVARAGEQSLDEQGNVKIDFGFMKSVYAGVAAWLRDHGLNIPFTNVELQGIIHDAGEWIKRDGNSVDTQTGIGENGQNLYSGLALNSFAGVRAEDAPLDALRVAREMQLTGTNDREIWAATGWTFGFADGKPRFEIADNHAEAVVEGRTMYQIWSDMRDIDDSTATVAQFMRKFPESPLSVEAANDKGVKVLFNTMATDDPALAKDIQNYFEHDLLYAAYPQIATIKAAQPAGMAGLVNAGNASLIPSNNLIKYSRIAGAEQFKSTTIHELQHAVQLVEGFARGGNPEEFKPVDVTDMELARINKQVHALYEANPAFYHDVVKANQGQLAVMEKYGSINGETDDPVVQDWWKAIDQRETHVESGQWYSLKFEESRLNREPIILSPMTQYSRLAGEVEARLTQARAELSAMERWKAYPLDQMDVPVGQQLVRFADARGTVAVDGWHVGKVLDVSNGVVVQKTGRAGEVTRHSMSRLSGPVQIGEVVEIKYANGDGRVIGQPAEKSLTR